MKGGKGGMRERRERERARGMFGKDWTGKIFFWVYRYDVYICPVSYQRVSTIKKYI